MKNPRNMHALDMTIDFRQKLVRVNILDRSTQN
jgi:hypothetical protein